MRNAEWQADEYQMRAAFGEITCALSLARLYAQNVLWFATDGDMCLTTREEAVLLLELRQKTLPQAKPFLINVRGLRYIPKIVCKSCASNYLLLH